MKTIPRAQVMKNKNQLVFARLVKVADTLCN